MYLMNIPQELKELDRWVCWRIEQRDGKPTKVPINPDESEIKRAKSDNPSTWSDFGTSLDKMKKCNLPGIGFVFNGDGIIGIDLDDCRDPETGRITDIGIEIIKAFDSYTEISPSGKGVHIICRGQLPKGKKQTFIDQDGHKAHFGIYDTGRFFCMTGNTLDDAHLEIEERTEQLAEIHAKYIEKSTGKNKNAPAPVQPAYYSASEDEVIERMMKSRKWRVIEPLLNGTWEGGKYASHSEADLALLNHLAYYSDKDPYIMESIFRKSGMYRGPEEKKNPKYLSITIEEAIRGTQSTFSDNAGKKKKKAEAKQEPPDIDLGYDQCFGQTDISLHSELPKWITGPYNDMWNAERFVEFSGEDIRYCKAHESWYIWNGKYWEQDKLEYIRSMADEAIKDLYKYKNDMYQKYGTSEDKTVKAYYTEFISWLTKSRNTGRKDNMIRETGGKKGIAILPDRFDCDQWVFNCKNGTIDLKTGKLRDFDRRDMISKIAPVEYDPEAKAPLWIKFLDRIFDGNKELINFIQRAVGYSLTGSNREQCMFVCHGSGANGKSTLINIIQDMLGEYAKGTNFSTFAIKNDSNTNDIARLAGARFVSAMEVGENKWMNAALIKQLTGGDKISARFLHKEFFEFVPSFKIWMGVNHKPGINETDHGTWRRIKLIPFLVTIPDNEKDEELPNKLKAEMPGILAWAVQGCLMWQKDGLLPPDEVNAATEAYRGEMDTLQLFINECTEAKEDGLIKSGDLYSVFKLWCDENGIRKPTTSTRFAVKLQEKGFKKDRTKVMRFWEGIQLSDYGKQLLHRKIEGKTPIEDYEQEITSWSWDK
jgi:putative DNA primase/helicase